MKHISHMSHILLQVANQNITVIQYPSIYVLQNVWRIDTHVIYLNNRVCSQEMSRTHTHSGEGLQMQEKPIWDACVARYGKAVLLLPY